jgi:hypothetical protein
MEKKLQQPKAVITELGLLSLRLMVPRVTCVPSALTLHQKWWVSWGHQTRANRRIKVCKLRGKVSACNFFCLQVLEFELKTTYLLGRHSTSASWATLPAQSHCFNSVHIDSCQMDNCFLSIKIFYLEIRSNYKTALFYRKMTVIIDHFKLIIFYINLEKQHFSLWSVEMNYLSLFKVRDHYLLKSQCKNNLISFMCFHHGLN